MGRQTPLRYCTPSMAHRDAGRFRVHAGPIATRRQRDRTASKWSLVGVVAVGRVAKPVGRVRGVGVAFDLHLDLVASPQDGVASQHEHPAVAGDHADPRAVVVDRSQGRAIGG